MIDVVEGAGCWCSRVAALTVQELKKILLLNRGKNSGRAVLLTNTDVPAFFTKCKVCADAQISPSMVTQPNITKIDRHTTATVPTIQMTELVVNIPVVHRGFKLMNRPIKSVSHISLDRSISSRPANLLYNSQVHRSMIDTYVNYIISNIS